MDFYGALFGWTFDVGPEEYGRYTTCLLDGRRAAALTPNPDPTATAFWWNVYLATDDLDATVARALEAGGAVVGGPFDIPEQGRGALLRDPVGAQFGLWQGQGHIGCEVVNEPGAEPVSRRYTNVWQAHDGGWRMIARHAQHIQPR